MVKIELYIQISDVKKKKSYKAKNENPSPSRYDFIGQSLWQPTDNVKIFNQITLSARSSYDYRLKTCQNVIARVLEV